MDQIIYWLKKLGILRAGKFSAKGDAKKMTEMEVKSELYQSDKEIDREKSKKNKKNKAQKEDTTEIKKSTLGKAIFWIFVLIGVFFLLAFWGSGWSFWTIVGLLMWILFLRWTWVHITSGFLALGKIFFLGALVIVLSLVFATPDESGKKVKKDNDGIEKTKKEEIKEEESLLSKGVEEDMVAEILLELAENTGIDFSKIKDDEVIWTAERINLKLEKGKSFQAEDLSSKDFDKLQKFFLGYGADTGGIGFTFTPPTETLSSGFAFRDVDHSGMMCVLIGSEEGDGVWVGCGWGPTNNPNSK
jgi:hypothetical protein